MSLDIGLDTNITTSVVAMNITHNLIDMWHEAGIYEALYESEGKKAKEVLPVLKEGYKKMVDDPERFKGYDSPNGWGTYKHALPWLNELINKFEQYPDGVIWIFT